MKTNKNQLHTLTQGFGHGSQKPPHAPNAVMAAGIKDLTGPLCYGFSCLARIFAEANPDLPIRERYSRVYTPYDFVLEEVMDAKKLDEEEFRQEQLDHVAIAQHQAVHGSALDAEAFAPFFPDDAMLEEFRGIAATASEGLGTCRGTAYGRLLASGSKLKRAVPKVIDRMLNMGINPHEILARLQADAHGDFLILPRPSGAGEEEEDEGGEAIASERGRLTVKNSEPDFLKRIYLYGRPLFEEVWAPFYDADGCFTVKARMRDYRDRTGKGRETFTMSLRFPAMTRKDLQVTPEGHRVVLHPGLSPRFYRPRLRLWKDELVMDSLADVLTEAFLEEIDRLPGLPRREGQEHGPHMGSPTSRRIEDYLNDAILACLSHLPPSDTQLVKPGAHAQHLLGPCDQVQRHEFQVHVREIDANGERLPIHEIWQRRRALLEQIHRQGGFDLLTTRKGEPGTLVTRAGHFGVAVFLHRLNPFARYAKAKRRVEIREIKQLLPLASPIEPSVRGIGTTLPKAWLKGITEAVCMVGDLNVNHFETDELDANGQPLFLGHDTIVAFQSALSRFALKEQVLKADTEHAKNEVLARLASQGVPLTSLTITLHEEQIAGNLVRTSYQIKVEGPFEDVGKIKALVGPIKGVMTLLPLRAFAVRGGVEREIDLCIPESTLMGKTRWGLDAWLYMECANYQIAEIDREWDLETLETFIEVSRPEGDDGLSEVYIEQGGERYLLGRCMVGVLPFFRPNQTGLATYRVRGRGRGIKLETHAAIMADVAPTLTRRENREFTQLVECLQAAKRLRYTPEQAPVASAPYDVAWDEERIDDEPLPEYMDDEAPLEA